MEYRKIDDSTVQCIISKEDMDEFGLSLSDIFERNEKGEDFLRTVISNAHEEVGYETNGGNIAMQITPMQDRGLVITFSDEGPIGIQNILEHLVNALLSSGMDLQRIIRQLHGQPREQERIEGRKEPVRASKQEDVSEERIFAFDCMDDVIAFCRMAYGEQKMGSRLYKEGETYYLVLTKKRMSRKDFDKLSIQAFDFSRPVEDCVNRFSRLEEYGECILEQQAVGKLKKIQ